MKNVRWQMLFQVVLVILIARVGVVNFLCHTQTMHTQITDHNELKPTKNRRSYTPKEQEHTNTHTHQILYHTANKAHIRSCTWVKPILEMTRRHKWTQRWKNCATEQESETMRDGKYWHEHRKKNQNVTHHKTFLSHSYLRVFDSRQCSLLNVAHIFAVSLKA